MTPETIGLSGTWRKTAFYITDSSYNVAQKEGDGSLRMAGYNGGDAQQWHLTALSGTGSDVAEYTMWVRIS